MYIFKGFLQIKGNYIVPALVGFPLNFITIAAIFLSSKTNILVLSLGSVTATASQLILMIPFIYKKGYKHKFKLNIKDAQIKKMLYITLPIIMGVSVNKINILVDRTLASKIAVGGISVLNYANKLNGFVQGLFVTSKYLGVGGLALATSRSALFSTVLLFISFRKKVGSFGMKNIIISIIKVLFASLIMGLVAKIAYNILLKYMGANLTLIAAIIIGAAIYLL